MRFLVFWQYETEDLEKVIKKFKQLTKDREKNPKKYPKVISGPFLFNGESKGITVCDAEDDEQVLNLHLYHQPLLTLSFVPIVDIDSAFEMMFPKK